MAAVGELGSACARTCPLPLQRCLQRLPGGQRINAAWRPHGVPFCPPLLQKHRSAPNGPSCGRSFCRRPGLQAKPMRSSMCAQQDVMLMRNSCNPVYRVEACQPTSCLEELAQLLFCGGEHHRAGHCCRPSSAVSFVGSTTSLPGCIGVALAALLHALALLLVVCSVPRFIDGAILCVVHHTYCLSDDRCCNLGGQLLPSTTGRYSSCGRGCGLRRRLLLLAACLVLSLLRILATSLVLSLLRVAGASGLALNVTIFLRAVSCESTHARKAPYVLLAEVALRRGSKGR